MKRFLKCNLLKKKKKNKRQRAYIDNNKQDTWIIDKLQFWYLQMIIYIEYEYKYAGDGRDRHKQKVWEREIFYNNKHKTKQLWNIIIIIIIIIKYGYVVEI